MESNQRVFVAVGATAFFALLGGALALSSCGSKPEQPKEAPKPVEVATDKAPEPVQDALEGGPYPALLMAQAWFWKDAAGKPSPGPARLDIWRDTGEGGWKATRLEDGDSNVFHKALQLEDGRIVTLGGDRGLLKAWSFADGKWKGEILWEGKWAGKFNRLRDIEIGDVDGDGKEEWVIATHDEGVVAVYNPPETPGAAPEVIELGLKADTFVHEIEIGDIDGDGKNEFFCTPSDRNQANKSQHGEIHMYRWDGSAYQMTVVDPGEKTHAKEVLVTDMDGDGKAELFGVMEAETDAKKNIVTPVTILQYTENEDHSFTSTPIATIQDRQTRFLVAADFDGDGKKELVAAALKTGLYYIDQAEDGTWSASKFASDASGFENAIVAADMDGDGKPELYSAPDDQKELRVYNYDAEAKKWSGKPLGRFEGSVFVWNLMPAKI